ncbi:MAG: peptide deformylase [Fimbriimonadaceae bacterium]|nr:peptide deformylase [Fimbriimonadaceae bacterium]QYK57396.1 MAG: peptide deformylase [Fimbriimonadaceae bacterium]
MQIVVPDEYQYLYVRDEKRPIYKIPADVLRKTALPVAKFTKKTQLMAENMLRLMRQANGVGLAAPQIGVLERIVVVAPEGRPAVMVNPEIVSREGSQVAEEGCLSIPGLYGDVERAATLVVRCLDRKGRECEYELEGLSARVVQHEIDHLDGILFIDKVDPATLHWTHPSPGGPMAE